GMPPRRLWRDFVSSVRKVVRLILTLLAFLCATHQPMPAERKASCIQPGFPSVAGADRCRVSDQAGLFLPLGQPSELGVEGVMGYEDRFFAVKDWRICAGVVFEAIDFAGVQ